MLFYLAIALPIVSVLYTVLLFFAFTCRGTVENSHVLKGKKTNYIFEICNKSPFLYPYIRIEFLESAKLLSEDIRPKVFSLLPFSRKKLNFELNCKYRGIFDIGIKSIELRDFLGIFSFKRKPKRHNNIIVYPHVIILESFTPVLSILSESNLASRSSVIEDMDVISEIRPYSYGDNPKRIHWKLTSKLSNVMVKKYQNNYNNNINIYIDVRKNSFSYVENIATEDKIIEAAISIIYYCLSNNISTNVVFFDNNYVKIEANNIFMFQEVYDVVSRLSFTGNTDINQLIERDLQNNLIPEAVIIFTCNTDFNPNSFILNRYLPKGNISLVYISPSKHISGIAQKEKSTLDSMSDSGINLYSIGTDDNIKDVLEKL
ncbi:MAG TPA: DUF58 domain-containing protein [Clostridiaceae bacterium]|nr:DUF58 domain-containing protein [Clostridiaceae bacterium]